MKVKFLFSFDEPQLRQIRAAIGRGGVATRKECVVFIDRAVRAAIDAAPTPKRPRTISPADPIAIAASHARAYPTGCPQLCAACVERLGTAHETDVERLRRVRANIARKFGHQGPKAVVRG